MKEQAGATKAALKNDYIDANNLNVDLDAPLYRIMNIDLLWDLLKNKRLGMIHPQRWDDPYEVFLMRSYGITQQGQGVGFEPITNSLYALCFSLKPECDGLWRSFSASSCKKCKFCDWRKKHGHHPLTVKIKTTGRKLMDAFYDINSKFHALNYWIGEVEYGDTQRISSMVSQGAAYITDNTGVNLIHTLLVKRQSFEYEKEVRLIYYMSSENPASQLNTTDLFFSKLIQTISLTR